MNEKYNQPTAHMLQPVKGWDSMAHLDFVAPIKPREDGIVALPGTVMTLDENGELVTGLTAQGMGMYLFYKQTDEDVQPYPITEDGTQMTAVGMQSFGGYNSEMYLRTWPVADPYNTNGTASNVQAYKFNKETGAMETASVVPSKAAHTTYPAICGMELSSTEFADKMGDGATSIQYKPNDTLTAPKPKAFDASKPGTAKQQAAGGFLKKGACYIDPICGIVSKKPVINEHGYKQICFWSTWLPAIVKGTDNMVDGATVKVTYDPAIFAGGPEFQFEFVDDQASGSGFDFDKQYAIAYTVNDGDTQYAYGNVATPATASLTKDVATTFVATVAAAGDGVGAVTVDGTATTTTNATVVGNKVTVVATAAQAANGNTIIIEVGGSTVATFTFA